MKPLLSFGTQITPFGEPNTSFGKASLSFETQLIPFGEPLEKQIIPEMETETLLTRSWSIQHGCFHLNHTFLRFVPGFLQYDNIVHVYTGNTNVNNDSLDNCVCLRQVV